jgi:hypothetical protein
VSQAAPYARVDRGSREAYRQDASKAAVRRPGGAITA